MDRQIIYPAAIPLETDLLNTNKYSMIGLAKLSSAIMGSNTYFRGLQCTPSTPASMIINIAAGEIYSLENVDNTSYSSLNADTTNSILKQGIVLSSTPFTLTAPTTAGQSINYLIQVTYTDTDSGATVLPYYNAANPSVAYSGPNNSGTAQNTVRSGVCAVALKAGVAATTGTQTTPSADTGYTAAWVITVAQGATTVISANISQAVGAPFIPTTGIVNGIQKKALTHGADIGSANIYKVNYSPAVSSLADGMELSFTVANSNTGSSNFSPNGATSYPIVSIGNTALTGGEIVSGGNVSLKWNATLSSWFLVSTTGSGASLLNLAATGRLLNIQIFTSSGTYTPTQGTKKIEVELAGGGGAGGSVISAGTASSTQVTGSSAAGGEGGAWGLSTLINAPTSAAIVVGAGGTASSSSPTNGGTSSFSVGGSVLLSVSGGAASPTMTGPTIFPVSLGGRSTAGNVFVGTFALKISGGAGGIGTLFNASSGYGGSGGASNRSTGSSQSLINQPTSNYQTTGPGCGGCGASSSSASAIGLSGQSGIVIIKEYA